MHTASHFLFSSAHSACDILTSRSETPPRYSLTSNASPIAKRVIITSSYFAVGNFGASAIPGEVYTEEDWNSITIEHVKAAFAKGIKGLAYLASKASAERAAWDFKATHKEHVE